MIGLLTLNPVMYNYGGFLQELAFEYPKIDENKCVHCYQCIKVCPIKAARAQ